MKGQIPETLIIGRRPLQHRLSLYTSTQEERKPSSSEDDDCSNSQFLHGRFGIISLVTEVQTMLTPCPEISPLLRNWGANSFIFCNTASRSDPERSLRPPRAHSQHGSPLPRERHSEKRGVALLPSPYKPLIGLTAYNTTEPKGRATIFV